MSNLEEFKDVEGTDLEEGVVATLEAPVDEQEKVTDLVNEEEAKVVALLEETTEDDEEAEAEAE